MATQVFLGHLRVQDYATLSANLSAFTAPLSGITIPHNSRTINFFTRRADMDIRDMVLKAELSYQINELAAEFYHNLGAYEQALTAVSYTSRDSLINESQRLLNEWNSAFEDALGPSWGFAAQNSLQGMAALTESSLRTVGRFLDVPAKQVQAVIGTSVDLVNLGVRTLLDPSSLNDTVREQVLALTDLVSFIVDNAVDVARGEFRSESLDQISEYLESLYNIFAVSDFLHLEETLRSITANAGSAWTPTGLKIIEISLKAMEAIKVAESHRDIDVFISTQDISPFSQDILGNTKSILKQKYIQLGSEIASDTVSAIPGAAAHPVAVKATFLGEGTALFLANAQVSSVAELSRYDRYLNNIDGFLEGHFSRLITLANDVFAGLPPDWPGDLQETAPFLNADLAAQAVFTDPLQRLTTGRGDTETLFAARPGQNLIVGQSARDTVFFEHPVDAYEIRLGQLSGHERLLLSNAAIAPSLGGIIEVDGRSVDEGIKKLIGIEQLIFAEGDLLTAPDLAIFGGSVTGRQPEPVAEPESGPLPVTPPPPPPAAAPLNTLGRPELLSVQIASQVVAPSQEVPLSVLFPAHGWINESPTQEITAFAVQDRTSGGGQLLRNGVAQAEQQVFVRPVEELDQWSFRAAPVQDARNAPLNIFIDEIGFNIILEDGRFSTRLPDGDGARVAALYQGAEGPITLPEPPLVNDNESGLGHGASLDVNILGIEASQFRPGGEVRISYEITNTGDAAALGSATGFYLSSSSNLARDGQLIGTQPRETLQPGQSQRQTFRFELDETATGQTQLGVWANHTRSWYDANGGPGIDLHPVTIAPLPTNPADLTLQFVRGVNNQLLYGAALEIEYDVVNIGSRAAERSSVSVFLSEHPTLDPERDRYLSEKFFGSNRGGTERGIEAGESDAQWDRITISEIDVRTLTGQAGPQNLYLHLLVDEDRRVAEANRANNVETLRFTVADTPDDWIGYVDNRVFDLTLQETALQPGGQATLSARIVNVGTIDAGNFGATADLVWTNLDTGESITRGAFFTGGGFGTGHGRSFEVTTTVTLPSDFSEGLYELRAWVRPDPAEPAALRAHNFSNPVRITVGDVPGELDRLAEALRDLHFDVPETQDEISGVLPLAMEGVTVTALRGMAIDAGLQSQGSYGALALMPDGQFAYTPQLPVSLPGEAVLRDTIPITLRDVTGAEAEADLNFNIIGVNSPAGIVGFATGQVSTDPDQPQQASGRLGVVDPDSGEDRFRQTTPEELDGTYGAFGFDALDGAWTYRLDPDRPALRDLSGDDVVTDTLTVTSLDGTASETITVTIQGTGNPLPDPGPSDQAQTGYLSGMILNRNGAALSETTVTFIMDHGPSQSVTSTGTGAFSIDLDGMVPGRLHASRAYNPATDGPITALDALDVLRLAVGIAPGWGPAHPHDFIAADITRDGQVTALDALEVLRAAVGLQGVHQPRWVFIAETADLAGIDRNNAAIETGIRIDPVDTDIANLAMTGILLGSMLEHA